MRIGIVSHFGYALSFAARLQDEGNEVMLWNDNATRKGLLRVGDGLVNKAGGYEELLSYVKEADGPALLFFTDSSLGERADDARKSGVHVIGGGKVCDRLEQDRDWGQKIVEDCGVMLPEARDFSTVSDAIEYAHTLGDTEVYWKSDRFLESDATYGAKSGEDLATYLQRIRRKYGNRIRCMVQDKIDGVPVSTAQWFNGKEFVGPVFGTIEHKKYMNDDVGPSTGCSLNAVWTHPEQSELAGKLGWPEFAATLRQAEAPPGIYDMNSVVDDDGNAYFLEHTPRCGYDSEPTAFRLLGDLTRFLWFVATGQGSPGDISSHIAYGVRLSVPPYPWEHVKHDSHETPIGVPIQGADGLWDGHFIPYQVMASEDGLAVACPEASVGLTLATSRVLGVAHNVAIDYAKTELRVPGLCYRTDGDFVIREDAKALRKVLSDIPEGLVK